MKTTVVLFALVFSLISAWGSDVSLVQQEILAENGIEGRLVIHGKVAQTLYNSLAYKQECSEEPQQDGNLFLTWVQKGKNYRCYKQGNDLASVRCEINIRSLSKGKIK